MSINENKAVVRRFVKEVLNGSNVDLVDEFWVVNRHRI